MNIIYEDNHLIIINKAPGELSQSDKTKDISLVDQLKNYLKVKLPLMLLNSLTFIVPNSTMPQKINNLLLSQIRNSWFPLSLLASF